MGSTRRIWLIVFVLALAQLSCGLFGGQGQAPAEEADRIATLVAATVEAQEAVVEPPTPTEEAEEQQAETLLPNDLYFLSSAAGDVVQVWHMSADGLNQTQLTFEAGDVSDFAVNPLDSSLAYVAENQILWVDAAGAERRVLVDGGPIDESSEDFYYRRQVSDPLWLPDGRSLAFAQDGLNILDIETAEIIKLLANEIEASEDGFLFPQALYFPLQLSQEGDSLLVTIGYFEGSGLALFDLSDNSMLTLGSGIVCCDPAWERDGEHIVVASRYYGLIDSGLWRYDLATGAEQALVPAQSDDGTFNFVGWPYQLPDGEFLYFYGSAADSPAEGTPLVLVRTASDGWSERVQLREDLLDVQEALWAPDGSLVIVMQPPPGELQWPLRGPLLLLHTDGSPIQPLGVNGYNLAWGP